MNNIGKRWMITTLYQLVSAVMFLIVTILYIVQGNQSIAIIWLCSCACMSFSAGMAYGNYTHFKEQS